MKLPVLLYHSVGRTDNACFGPWAVGPERFAAQMDLLAREGYRAVTISQLADLLWDRTQRLPPRLVAITFDDGFADFYSEALPHLLRNDLVATVFVTTAHVGRTSAWLARDGEGERPMMSWDQIDEIAAAGIEVGAHSHRHVQLDTVPRARAAAEIELSKRAVQDAIGSVASFAYPHGYHTASVRRAVRRAGFTSACAVGDGMASSSDDRYAITRAIVRGETSLEHFAEILRGRDGTRRPRPVRRVAWRAVRYAGCEPLVDRVRASLLPRPFG